jgi:hypothetical protein
MVSKSVRLQSCRYATLLRYVHDYHFEKNGAFCALGESAGAGEIAYALTTWHEAPDPHVAVLSGGPPFTRLDFFCPEKAGGTGWVKRPNCFSPQEVLRPTKAFCEIIVDKFAFNTCCGCPCELREDSILYPGVEPSYPTRIHTIIGEFDPDFAAPAYEFYLQTKSEKVVQFVPNGVHTGWNTPEGADAILRAIMAGAFAKTAMPSFPATLSVDDWVSVGGPENINFSLQGPPGGTFEIFYSCGHVTS